MLPVTTFFLYLHATDLDAMRRFYGTIVGLEEIFWSPGPKGAIGYRHGSVQFTVLAHDSAKQGKGWARQPGWSGGTEPTPSWSFELGADAFRTAIARARAAGWPAREPAPEWRGYWGWVLLDPMGNTVEITCPDRRAWA